MIPILITALTYTILTFYMTILAFQYDMFTLKVITVFHYWNCYHFVLVAVSLHYGSKAVRNCNKLMVSVAKIANEWDDEEVLNRVCSRIHFIYDYNNKQVILLLITVQIIGNTIF